MVKEKLRSAAWLMIVGILFIPVLAIVLYFRTLDIIGDVKAWFFYKWPGKVKP